MKYLGHIDGIRAIAIISVIFFHLKVNSFNGGFVGVDIFFVISGFLITQKIKYELEINKSFNFKNFYFKRIQRLAPALIFTLLLSSIFAIVIMSPTHLKSFGQSLYSAVLGFSNIYFYQESDYFNTSSYLKPLLHTWSLSIEFQFYLLYPIFIYFINKIYKLNLKAYLLLFLIFISVNLIFTFNMADKIDELSKAKMFFLLQFRVFEFILGGILVYIIGYEFKQKFVYDILFLIGLLFICYAIYTFDEKLLYPSYYALLPTLGTIFLIYSGLHTKFKFLLTNNLIIFVGLISYSLYLVHWPIIVFYEYIVGDLNIYDKFIILFLTFILGYFSYRYIENSFRKTLHPIKYINNIFILIIVIFVFGYCMKYFDGWKWRIQSNQITDKILVTDNYHKDFYGGAGYSSNGFISAKKDEIDILLMGDSHGKHYVDGLFKAITSKYDYSFYNASGYSCIHLPNFIRPITHPLCREKLNNALNLLNKDEKTLVIISHSWINQINRSAIVDDNGKITNNNIQNIDILNGILELKSKIGNNELLVIGQVPTSGDFNLYDIFSRPSLPFIIDDRLNKHLETSINKEYMNFNIFLKKASIETKSFHFLDPFDILCNSLKCKNIDDDSNLIYSDTGHLSIYGSRYIISGFEEKIIQILNNLNKEKR